MDATEPTLAGDAEPVRVLLARLAVTSDVATWNAWRRRRPDRILDLRAIALDEAYLPAIDLRGADLRDARFVAADLRGADLRGADLRGADVARADLRGATLTKARLRGVHLASADVRGVLWDFRASWRAWPRGWVVLALVSGGAIPLKLALGALAAFAREPMGLGERIALGLVVFGAGPLGLFFLWCVVRFALLLPFNLFLILKLSGQRIQQRDGCMAVIQVPVLFMVLLIDAVDPLPFLDTFGGVMAGELVHGDAVLAMRAKAVAGYLALLLIDAWALAQRLTLDPVDHFLWGS